MNETITALVLTAAVVSFLFMIVYMTFGRPWQGFFGRSLMALQGGLFAVLAYSAYRRLTLTAIPIPHALFAVAVGAYGLVALVELLITSALWGLLIRRRGGIRAAWRTKIRRRAALVADEMSDHLRTLATTLDLLADDEYALVMSTTRPR